MNKETLAENLYESALKSQWERENKKTEFNPRQYGGEFKDLWPAPKSHYFAMAEWVLNNKNLL